ncbi:MAG: hypothetical protein EAX86_09310 [Candidatus Heimdallarchaeota archaeon]|nr:hypothetical protein [Candidatus Heimdallarchaeota archaeon]
MHQEPDQTQDFITYEPEIVKYLTEDQIKLVNEYDRIIKALKNKYLTVKEIHELYFNFDLKKYRYSLKTIYKHLDKLDKHGLVKIAGYRAVKGKRVSEKIYTRTAHLFYPMFITKPSKEEEEKHWHNANGIYHILSYLMKKQNIPSGQKEQFFDFYGHFQKIKFNILLEILESLTSNMEIAAFLSSISVDEVNDVNDIITILAYFIRFPEMLEQLKGIFI